MHTRSARAAVTAALLAAASTLPSAALAVYEAEPNDSVATAQRLMIGSGGGAEVTGSIGDPLATTIVNDADFYAFEGREGDVVTIDIDHGMKSSGRSVDTILTLFRPDLVKERENDDASPPDPGSLFIEDARLTNVRLPVSGTYFVAVSAWSMTFRDGGSVAVGSRARSNGSYSLIISGVTPSVQQINIGIKPGDQEIAPVNPKARGNIPVALLSSPDFDALSVDRTSITFGATGDEASLLRCHKNGTDVNRDGRPDLLCHFGNQAAGFEPGDLEGIVRGRTATGGMFEGRGLLKVVPQKRQR